MRGRGAPGLDGGGRTALFSRGAVAGSCGGMLIIGVLLALYGPVVPALRDRFGLSESTAGLALAAQSLGAVLGVVGFHAVHRRIGNRAVLAWSYLTLATGAVAFGLVGVWPLMMAAAVVAGLGLGGVDFAISRLFLVGLGARGPVLLNVAHGCFGLGTVLAPAVVAVVGPDRFAAVFVVLGLLSVVPLVLVRGIRPRPTPYGSEDGATAEQHTFAARRRPTAVLGGFAALYLLHFAVQSGIGSWEPTHLQALGHSASAATFATSLYWLAMTVGRFLVAPLARRWSAAALVTTACVLMTVCVLLVPVTALTPWAYAAAGLCIGPIFPNGLTWLGQRAPAAGNAMAYVVAAAMLGSVAVPPALGAAIEAYGVGALPVVLGALCLVTVAVSVALAGRPARAGRGGRSARSSTPPRSPAVKGPDLVKKEEGTS